MFPCMEPILKDMPSKQLKFTRSCCLPKSIANGNETIIKQQLGPEIKQLNDADRVTVLWLKSPTNAI